nr:hypothetical protein [Tanacetum cinerariifolium]GEZ99420.1 hypothetical protein [Tanacetum cinerariifolium]GFA67619.1 hypothetical protein [Tanacetum cinerariifolium]
MNQPPLPMAGKGFIYKVFLDLWSGLTYITRGVRVFNVDFIIVTNQPNDNAGIKENLDADDDVADVAFNVKENENDVHVSANGSAKYDNKKHDEKDKRDGKGKRLVDSLT